MLIILAIIFLFISLATLAAVYDDPRVHIVAFFLFILSIIFIIGAILLHRSGNKEIREAKEHFERENQEEINLDKDRRIKELEKRLEKIEEDKTKSEDNPENS